MMKNEKNRHSLISWYRSGAPYIWLNAGAVTVSMVAVVGLLLLLAVRGFSHFWAAPVLVANYQESNASTATLVMGEIAEEQMVSLDQLRSAGLDIEAPDDSGFVTRYLIKAGNRDISGRDFIWVIAHRLKDIERPKDVVVIERREWGNFYGTISALKTAGEYTWQASETDLFDVRNNALFQKQLSRTHELQDEIKSIEKRDIGKINHGLERLRLKRRQYELSGNGALAESDPRLVALQERRAAYEAEYESLKDRLTGLYTAIQRDSLVATTVEGREVEIPFAKVVQVFQPNAMSISEKLVAYLHNFWLFLSDDPREANTEGGIFPAMFGTVMMVMLMSVLVTPFGVVAAVYLHEYARQGAVTRLIRIAVNNLAGVPSIVYGVFGLGFFVYFVGGNIDQLFFAEGLPAPTFGTPGLLWASLTLSILTLPVVIVATEEGLARIPRSVREGSLALGATKSETLWRVVLPIASPAIMTGLILAVARAAGEVAPLMLVGVVKLAPTLPLDANFPFLHLDQKFMHLGFHIFDVGFQSPNVEAARPLVYATSLLLVVIIALLNLAAVTIRNHLREKYKALEN